VNEQPVEIVRMIVDRLIEEGVELEKFDVNNNRVNLVSTKRGHNGLRVRVALSVLKLGSKAVEPIVAFVARKPGGQEHMRLLIRQIPGESRPPSKRRTVIRSQGYHHDLHSIAKGEVDHFDRPPDVWITWGQRRRIKRGQRHIRFGSFDPERNVVRIHRILDHPRVPSWFIGFIIYHEMLHRVLGVDVVNGRRRPHSKEFRAREAEHPRYDAAQSWEKANINRLLEGRL